MITSKWGKHFWHCLTNRRIEATQTGEGRKLPSLLSLSSPVGQIMMTWLCALCAENSFMKPVIRHSQSNNYSKLHVSGVQFTKWWWCFCVCVLCTDAHQQDNRQSSSKTSRKSVATTVTWHRSNKHEQLSCSLQLKSPNPWGSFRSL